MATSNFLVHDSDKNNIQNDGDFLASAIRTGGFVSGVAPSVYFNKLLYQLSTMIAALGQAMANKGYTVADTTLSTLTTALENIMTLADMTDYPTNSEMVTYVASQIPAIDFTNLKTTNGYQKIPGGLIIQWGGGVSYATGSSTIVTFPIPFTAMAFFAGGFLGGSSNISGGRSVCTGAISKTGAIFYSDQADGASTGTMSWFAIGY